MSYSCRKKQIEVLKLKWEMAWLIMWGKEEAGVVPLPGQSTVPLWWCKWCSPSAPWELPCQPAASRAELNTDKRRRTPHRKGKTMMHRGIMEISFRALVCALTLQVLDLFSGLFGLLVVTPPLFIEQGCRQSQPKFLLKWCSKSFEAT